MERTIAIIDLAHHGTTMVAGLCQILGIPMVDGNYDEEKWEDLEIRDALRKSREAFETVVQLRNAQHDIWGFKVVGAWLQAPSLKACLRDPVYLAIYKDPVSVTGRRFRSIATGKLLDTVVQMQMSIEGIRASGLPVHLLSYHKAVISPVEFVRRLAGYIGVTMTSVHVDRAVGYIQPNRGSQKRKYPEVEPWI